jgi:hypothetical protein
MSLPDRDAVKLRLRIEDDVEDDDLDLMMGAATAVIVSYIGRPLDAAERTWTIEDPRALPGRLVTRLILPLWPIEDDSVEITDADGEAVTDFRVNLTTGVVFATPGTWFGTFPYTVTATTGLSLLPDYGTLIEPAIGAAFLDLCADWYQRRNTAALAEGAGGGVITQWQPVGIPERVCEQLWPYRLIRIQ